MQNTKKKLVILANTLGAASTLPHYRMPIYRHLASIYDALLLSGNRDKAGTVDAGNLTIEHAWGFQFKSRKRTGVANVSDTAYIHLNPGILWQLARYKPDAILSNEMGFRSLAALIYGKLARIPVWIWWGGTIHSERNISRSRRILRPLIVRMARHWISYGTTSTDYLLSLGVKREQVVQVQNSVPQETFQLVPEDPQPWFKDIPHPVLLTVGQLIARKGLDVLIQSCGRLSQKGYKFTLALVGKGPEKDELRALAERSGIESLVMIPQQSQSSLNEIYRAADLFVFPTVEDVWGLVVNEALWTGLPVVCSRYAGCAPELIPEEDIFDPLVPESIDRALIRFLEGKVQPPDQSRLMTWETVAEKIAAGISASIRS